MLSLNIRTYISEQYTAKVVVKWNWSGRGWLKYCIGIYSGGLRKPLRKLSRCFDKCSKRAPLYSKTKPLPPRKFYLFMGVRWVFSVTPRPLYPSEITCGIYWTGGWLGGSYNLCGSFGENSFSPAAGRRTTISWFQTFTVRWILIFWFWGFTRCVGWISWRRFGNHCGSHLHWSRVQRINAGRIQKPPDIG